MNKLNPTEIARLRELLIGDEGETLHNEDVNNSPNEMEKYFVRFKRNIQNRIEAIDEIKQYKPTKELLGPIFIAWFVTPNYDHHLAIPIRALKKNAKEALLKIAPPRIKYFLKKWDDPLANTSEYLERIKLYLDSLLPEDAFDPLTIAIASVIHWRLWGHQYIFKHGTPEMKRKVIECCLEGTTFSLDFNRQIEQLPDELAEYQQITKVSLIENKLKLFPLVLTRLKNLKELNLDSNYELSEVPAEIAHLQNLEFLGLGCSKINSLPVEISQLRKLEWLQLALTKFEDFPIEVTAIKQLKKISIYPLKLKRGFREILLKMEYLQSITCAAKWADPVKYIRPFDELP